MPHPPTEITSSDFLSRDEANDLAREVERFLRAQAHPAVQAFLEGWPRLHQPDEAPRMKLPVLGWMDQVASPGDASYVAHEVARLSPRLEWRQSYGKDDFGAAFLDRYGYAELVGMRGPIRTGRIACGVLLLGPWTEYPLHSHVAEEIYILLAGTGLIRSGASNWTAWARGSVTYHASATPHAMRTAADPVLALYLWRNGDLTEKPCIVG